MVEVQAVQVLPRAPRRGALVALGEVVPAAAVRLAAHLAAHAAAFGVRVLAVVILGPAGVGAGVLALGARVRGALAAVRVGLFKSKWVSFFHSFFSWIVVAEGVQLT